MTTDPTNQTDLATMEGVDDGRLVVRRVSASESGTYRIVADFEEEPFAALFRETVERGWKMTTLELLQGWEPYYAAITVEPTDEPARYYFVRALGIDAEAPVEISADASGAAAAIEEARAGLRPTAQELAEHLNSDREIGNDAWTSGFVTIQGQRLEIDFEASDALAARRGHEGRNESESRWLAARVAGAPQGTPALEVEYMDGAGWQPVEEDA